jgi:hypothetical protein
MYSKYPCPPNILWTRVGGDDASYGNTGFCRGSGRKVDVGRGNASDVQTWNFKIATWSFDHDYSPANYRLPHEIRIVLHPNTSLTQGELRVFADIDFEYSPGNLAGTILFEFKPIIADQGNEIIIKLYGLESPATKLEGDFTRLRALFNNGAAADDIDMVVTTGELRD